MRKGQVKQSISQYRNIKGIRYIFWTASQDLFEEEIKKAKESNISYRIIGNQMYLEKR